MNNNVITLRDYKQGLNSKHFARQKQVNVQPRCELFKSDVEKKVLVETEINVDREVSIMFKLQDLALSIDSSIITRVALFPMSLGCKVLYKLIKTRLARQVIKLTEKVIV